MVSCRTRLGVDASPLSFPSVRSQTDRIGTPGPTTNAVGATARTPCPHPRQTDCIRRQVTDTGPFASTPRSAMPLDIRIASLSEY